MSGLKEASTVREVLIDRDCPMCQRFGRSLSADGFTVTPREAARSGSIEVTLSDGSSRFGYFAMLEIFRHRGWLPSWLFAALGAPLVAFFGQLGYGFIAYNRRFLSRLLVRS